MSNVIQEQKRDWTLPVIAITTMVIIYLALWVFHVPAFVYETWIEEETPDRPKISHIESAKIFPPDEASKHPKYTAGMVGPPGLEPSKKLKYIIEHDVDPFTGEVTESRLYDADY